MNIFEKLEEVKLSLDTISSEFQSSNTHSKVCEDGTYRMHIVLFPFGDEGGAVMCVRTEPFEDEPTYKDSADASIEIFATYKEALDIYERTEL
jgi:hypothetical protein